MNIHSGKAGKFLLCILLAIISVVCLPAFLIVFGMLLPSLGLHWILCGAVGLAIPLAYPLLILQKPRRYKRFYHWYAAILAIACAINLCWYHYDQSRIIDTNPNIEVYKYYPGYKDNLLVPLPEEAALQFGEGSLPRIDGATAVFPVYSAFVQAVYPEGAKLYGHSVVDGNRKELQSFWDESDEYQYNNTIGGYDALADKATDIFFGAYPSQEQIAYAQSQGTTFVYTPIGYEAFVFFVHKDNPVDSLTTEEIQKIYSGEITNWNQVGGKNQSITAYQRNEGSGSQSMFLRFMDDVQPMSPTTEELIGGMGGIITQVADYRSSTASIGFSFRYYVETIIANPDIKILAIDGVYPTAETIQNGTYPIVGPLYAVTWEGNENRNVQLLLDWILSPQGQYIIQETGYIPIGPTK